MITAVELTQGKTPTAINAETDNGVAMIPTIHVIPKLVTKDNIDEIVIDPGWHKAEDVYKNVPKSQWPAKYK